MSFEVALFEPDCEPSLVANRRLHRDKLGGGQNLTLLSFLAGNIALLERTLLFPPSPPVFFRWQPKATTGNTGGHGEE